MGPSQPPLPSTFEGFPYLVTRIGHTPLRHISLLPATWSREGMLEVARRQVAANRLDTCLCLGHDDAVYLGPDGSETKGTPLVVGIPLTDRLLLPEPVADTPELVGRKASLRIFCERIAPQGGFLVGDGLEGGRHATPADVMRLGGRDGSGIPAGLLRCADCSGLRGEHLAVKGEGNGDMTPRVVDVYCRCQNHNRCARCGGPLTAGRLSAYEYDEVLGELMYRAAYSGLAHRCP